MGARTRARKYRLSARKPSVCDTCALRWTSVSSRLVEPDWFGVQLMTTLLQHDPDVLAGIDVATLSGRLRPSLRLASPRPAPPGPAARGAVDALDALAHDRSHVDRQVIGRYLILARRQQADLDHRAVTPGQLLDLLRGGDARLMRDDAAMLQVVVGQLELLQDDIY